MELTIASTISSLVVRTPLPMIYTSSGFSRTFLILRNCGAVLGQPNGG